MFLKKNVNQKSDYKISKRLIGRGVYSMVYFGTVIKSDMKVAIKKISLNNLSSDIKSSVKKEIDIVNILIANPHPNIVKYYDIIETKTNVYIIMEFCENGNFSSLLVKPMREKYARYYFRQIIKAIEFLKGLGIVHRDIKPDNILLSKDYRYIKLCDFGFAEKIEDICADRYILCGSPMYMAPEILANKYYDDKIDVWSSGMILYEMIYGYHPFRGLRDIESIKICYIEIERTYDIDVDDNGLYLLGRLLQIDRRIRLDAFNIMEEAWVKVIDTVESITLSNIYHTVKLDNISSNEKNKKGMFDILSGFEYSDG